MSTTHYRTAEGRYIGGFGDGAMPPSGAVECPSPPHADATWDGSGWIAPAAPVPAVLTKLQIRRQAVEDGIWSDLKAFIASDPDRQEEWDLAVAIPTDDPIITDAKAALQWTEEQAEAFIRAAGKK